MPSGMAALVVAIGLGVAFLLASLVCLLVVGASASQQRVPLARHRAFPHLRGLLLCLLGYGAVVLFLLANDGPSSSGNINQWLDNAVLVWATGILALWPLSVLAARRGAARG